MRAWLRRRIVAPPVAPRSVARTHVGRTRAINEDRVLDDAAAGLWAVVDGMGGHGGGDVAAELVVAHLRRAVPEGIPAEDALVEANAALHRRNLASGGAAGATAVVATHAGGTLGIAWAGDSRAYRLRDGRAEPLTRDHSVVQELLDAGLLTPALARDHPRASVVTRAVGAAAALAVERRSVPVRAGDRFLLCSDGLSRSLDEAGCPAGLPLEALADALLADALSRDGSDNISLVLIEPVPAASTIPSPCATESARHGEA